MNKPIRIPEHATRCVVLIPNGTPTPLNEKDRTHALSKEAEVMVKSTKYGFTNLIDSLGQFGQPWVICGQNPASIMTAVHGGKHRQIKTTTLLDTTTGSKNEIRQRARTLLRENKDQPLLVAYGNKKIISKLAASTNPNVEKCHDLEDGIEAAVMFLNCRGKLIAAHKQSLLTTMAAT